VRSEGLEEGGGEEAEVEVEVTLEDDTAMDEAGEGDEEEGGVVVGEGFVDVVIIEVGTVIDADDVGAGRVDVVMRMAD
jgi:hypothetical protein